MCGDRRRHLMRCEVVDLRVLMPVFIAPHHDLLRVPRHTHAVGPTQARNRYTDALRLCTRTCTRRQTPAAASASRCEPLAGPATTTGGVECAPMAVPPNVYRCRMCTSTSYRRLTQRGPDGVMRYSGVYRCSGCSFTFSDPSVWRERRLRPRCRKEGMGSDAVPTREAPARGTNQPGGSTAGQ